jgi:hypothetical protein
MLTYDKVTQAAWQSAKQAVAAEFSVQITTDSGNASSNGFTVHWNYDAALQTLSIQCTDSPFWTPCSTINAKINSMVEAVLNQRTQRAADRRTRAGERRPAALGAHQPPHGRRGGSRRRG